MWFVYALISKRSGRLYIGMTQDVQRRLTQHNSGKSKFTSGHTPWELIYQENFNNAKEARAREKSLKSASGRRFIRSILDAGSLPD